MFEDANKNKSSENIINTISDNRLNSDMLRNKGVSKFIQQIKDEK